MFQKKIQKPNGFRDLSQDELETVGGGIFGTIFFINGSFSFIPGGGFGDTSGSGNPFGSLSGFTLEDGENLAAAIAEWEENGFQFPVIEIDEPGVQPSEDAPPIANPDAPAGPSGSAQGGPNTSLQ